MLNPGRQLRVSSGFTLIEVMVGVSIVGILLALGLPSLNAYMANSKIRASASTFNAGVQFARAEAIRLNGGVELVLTNDDPVAANVDSAVPSTTGKNWLVRALNPAAATFTLLEGKAAANGSTAVTLTGSSNKIGFDGLGASVPAGTTATFVFSNPSGGACATASGPMRCLQVEVTAGGQVRLCDPAVATAGDARKCSYTP